MGFIPLLLRYRTDYQQSEEFVVTPPKMSGVEYTAPAPESSSNSPTQIATPTTLVPESISTQSTPTPAQFLGSRCSATPTEIMSTPTIRAATLVREIKSEIASSSAESPLVVCLTR